MPVEQVRIILVGANGRLGRIIAQCAHEKENCAIVAGVDLNTTVYDDFPIFDEISKFQGEADVIIDFSHPAGLRKLLDFSIGHGMPAVISTTGFSEPQVEEIRAASQRVPVFFTANMSLGVNLLRELARKAASVLGDDFDIEIVEKHHNQKVDAPSGTALMLADEINDVCGGRYSYAYNRQDRRIRRPKDEIGISAIRGGTIVGEHDIIFAGLDEVITLSHAAYSKGVFATGSINAALFMAGQKPGLYTMQDLLANS